MRKMSFCLWFPKYVTDCNLCLLYFEKNCAVRKAYLQKRVVETLYPRQDKKVSGFWFWFLEKIGIRRELDGEAEESVRNVIAYPWHLMKSGDDDLHVLSRRY